MLNTDKRFGAVTALRGASLNLMPGEIRALLGANGSGKSTMVKILGGMLKPDGGTITLEGEPLWIHSPRDSRRNRIAVAYQDTSLVPQLSVTDNIMLGQELHKKAGFCANADMRQRVCKLLQLLKIELSPEILVGNLDPAMQSMIEVLKALAWEPRYLILDEVTASLHHDQVKRLFELLREKQRQGLGILFVSHRFEEVFSLCETATVLRGGETVQSSIELSQVNAGDLVYFMTGQYPEKSQQTSCEERVAVESEPILTLKDVYVGKVVNGVSFQVHKGEIVGFGGLQGQGQAELLRAITGAIPFKKGEIRFQDKPVHFKSPSEAVHSGIGFISGDREREGILQIRPVSENLFLAKFALGRIGSIVHSGKLKSGAQAIIERLKIVAGGPGLPANSLSGGNQQKLIVGRWLMLKPKLLLLDDPTKGVDVNARREIHKLLEQMAADGTTIIISSSDNEELMAVASRILVFYEGKIAAELCGEEKTETRLVSAMLGVEPTGRGGIL
jgi:ABC-type sugar transport system, ATPase component